MRTIKELLQIMYDNVEELINSEATCGLCGTLVLLRRSNTISDSEYKRLDSYLYQNKPSSRYDSMWWFKPRLVEPRKEWLLYHISIN